MSTQVLSQQGLELIDTVAYVPTSLPPPTGFTLHSWPNYEGLQDPAWGSHPFRNRAVMESGLEYGDTGIQSVIETAYLGGDTAQGTASKLTGLIYLEEGHSYTLHHQGSGTLSIVIGGTAFNSSGGALLVEDWGEYDGNDEPGISESFTPGASGFYELNIFHYAYVEAGDLEIKLQVDNETPQPLDTAYFALYDSAQTLVDAGITLEQAPGGHYIVVAPSESATGLVESSWFDLDLSSNGRGEAPDRLLAAVDDAGIANSVSTVDDAQLEGVLAGTTTRLSGVIGLEGGTTYTFSGQADDSFRLIVDDEIIADGRWCRSQGNFSGSFTPQEDGYYSLVLYHHNAAGPGGLEIGIQIDDGAAQPLDSEHFALYHHIDNRPTTPVDTVGVASPAEGLLLIA